MDEHWKRIRNASVKYVDVDTDYQCLHVCKQEPLLCWMAEQFGALVSIRENVTQTTIHCPKPWMIMHLFSPEYEQQIHLVWDKPRNGQILFAALSFHYETVERWRRVHLVQLSTKERQVMQKQWNKYKGQFYDTKHLTPRPVEFVSSSAMIKHYHIPSFVKELLPLLPESIQRIIQCSVLGIYEDAHVPYLRIAKDDPQWYMFEKHFGKVMDMIHKDEFHLIRYPADWHEVVITSPQYTNEKWAFYYNANHKLMFAAIHTVTNNTTNDASSSFTSYEAILSDSRKHGTRLCFLSQKQAIIISKWIQESLDQFCATCFSK